MIVTILNSRSSEAFLDAVKVSRLSMPSFTVLSGNHPVRGCKSTGPSLTRHSTGWRPNRTCRCYSPCNTVRVGLCSPPIFLDGGGHLTIPATLVPPCCPPFYVDSYDHANATQPADYGPVTTYSSVLSRHNYVGWYSGI